MFFSAPPPPPRPQTLNHFVGILATEVSKVSALTLAPDSPACSRPAPAWSGVLGMLIWKVSGLTLIGCRGHMPSSEPIAVASGRGMLL